MSQLTVLWQRLMDCMAKCCISNTIQSFTAIKTRDYFFSHCFFDYKQGMCKISWEFCHYFLKYLSPNRQTYICNVSPPTPGGATSTLSGTLMHLGPRSGQPVLRGPWPCGVRTRIQSGTWRSVRISKVRGQPVHQLLGPNRFTGPMEV